MPEKEYYDNACANIYDDEGEEYNDAPMNRRKKQVYDELRREKDAIMRNMYTTNACVLVEKTNRWGETKLIKKNVKITYFSSGDNGSYIRDAVTGIVTKYRVGSAQERLFYTVTMAKSNLYTKCPIGYDNGSVKLFYSSPGEFEKHQYERVSDKIRAAWYANQSCEDDIVFVDGDDAEPTVVK